MLLSSNFSNYKLVSRVARIQKIQSFLNKAVHKISQKNITKDFNTTNISFFVLKSKSCYKARVETKYFAKTFSIGETECSLDLA
jgi:hypothetical protein